MKSKLVAGGLRVLKFLVLSSGVLFLMACIFAITTGPFYLYHYLGTGNSAYRFRPQVIIVLGSTPIPSETALIRCYYARQLADSTPGVQIIISQLAERKQLLTQSAAWKMSREIGRGRRDSLAFGFLLNAHSTREEAILLPQYFPGIRGKKCVLITSPEHMFRAISVFRRAGYQQVGGEPTFSWAGNADYRYQERKSGGRWLPVEVGDNLQLRYQFWNHLRYQLLCYREIAALFWYRLRGWA